MGDKKSKPKPPPKKPDACASRKGHDYCKKLPHGPGKCLNISGGKEFTCSCPPSFSRIGINAKTKCVRKVCKCGKAATLVPFGEPDFGDSGGVDNGTFGGYLDGTAGADDGNYNGNYDGNNSGGNNSGGNHEVAWGLGGFVLALTLVMCFQFAKYVIKRRKLKNDKAGFLLSKEPEKSRPDVDTPDALLNKNEVERTAAGRGAV